MHRASLLFIALPAFLVSLLVLHVSAAPAPLDVRSIAVVEIETIEQRGFAVPPFTLITLDKWGTAGNTVLMNEPVKYVIILWNFYYEEAQARKVVAHEIAHVLLAEAGVPQSEVLADTFAACFGSELAQQWAQNIDSITPSPAECRELGEMLMQGGQSNKGTR